MGIVDQSERKITSTGSLRGGTKCHTCGEAKPGLFTIDVYGKPLCAGCARAQKRPID